jgi:predicted unusual protein kinase regulating ubiquinone biosynthesis (AarF/ABC1/UbiB family)
MSIDQKISGLAVPSGRVARLSRLGRMTAGVAGNMAVGGLAQLGRGQRPSLQGLLLTPRNIGRIADELAKMRGAAMKMGQLMSMDTGDVLPLELSQIMARLRDDAHVMPPKQLKAVLNDQWGEGWLARFARFDVRPIAAASIGQVHRATTRDGRDLAIKVQYPGVAASIDSDVTNVGALIKLTGLLPRGFALDHYLDEARVQLHAETDYTAEAEALSRFGALLNGDDRFVVPQGHADWSGRQILAMDYIESVAIEDAEAADQKTRNSVAHDLFDLMLRELFGFGLMQTDPNFANYRYKPQTGQIVLLDFGATRRLGSDVAQAYRALMYAGLSGHRDGLIEAAMQIGFVTPEITPQHLERIIGMLEAVFTALSAYDVFDFADTRLSQQLQSEGMALAQDGFVPPPLPMDALFLQRKFAGMFLLAARLRAQVDVVGLMKRWL